MIRESYVDRERVLREGVTHLRAAWAAHPADPALTGLVAEFMAQVDGFAGLWAERDIEVNGSGRKVIRHPGAGVIAVRFEVLVPLQDTDQRLMIGRADDDASRSALDRLCA
ncbi:MmyB family transcriptional regulator [Streptomyces sp. JW3]|uniref:MmyB family transcriptional regulator n=1 Tax=Streptomyces sp. JW3 TaxID=3456955 RepID=UPI003FA4B68A